MADAYKDFKKELPDYVRTETDFELYKMRHSAEHILTQAMIELYGSDKIIMAMGPATADGFYFDFESHDIQINEAEFPKIEAKMKEIIKAALPIVRKEISPEEVEKLFKSNPYKLEWLKTIKESKEPASFYYTGDQFFDLCRGPHIDNTSNIGVFKLLKIAGAYWHGDEHNIMLTRIYGTAFKTQQELDDYLWKQEEAKKRDHRKLARDLDLYTFSELVGSGMPLYAPRGALIRRTLNDYIEELQSAANYKQVWTPQIAKADLFKISGHYDKYKADMFRVISNYSDEEMYLKPMNCPQHTQIYASRPRSYKELPMRLTDFAMLYRDERPGELLGLARVRSFSTDDCHVFCTEEQVDAEVDLALQMTKKVMATLGFKYRYRLSTRDPENRDKYLGHPEVWDRVEKWAVTIMERNGIEYFDGPGEAAFYAPKMDLMATDSLGREWQLSTVQIDFVMPERFDLKYTAADGTEKRPVMLHRAILGSAERMMMILIENFAGAFPAWLSPEQVRIIPISDQNREYATKIADELNKAGIRNSIDVEDDRMQNKIRQAQELKIPYMFIVGKKEEEKGVVSLRYRSGEEFRDLKVVDVVSQIKDNIYNRLLDIKLF